MAKDIDIDRTDSGPAQAPAGDGSRTRHSFSLSIVLSIVLAGFVFYHLLGRTTDDAQSRLNIDVRPAETVYNEAAQIETPTLKLRALRNFKAAYPSSPQADTAREGIETLEADEHSAWTGVTEIYYDVTKSAAQKRDVLEAFKGQWDGGSYSEEILIMEEQLEQDTPKSRKLNEATGTVPGLAGSDIKLPRRSNSRIQSAAISDDALAGDLPMAKTYPIPMAETLPLKPAQTIIDAKVTKDSRPSYPSRAQRRGDEGDVTISMDIGIDGKVIDARVVKAATGKYASDFGKAAIRAAKRTRFSPKTIDGEPAPTNGFTRIYKFRLED